MNPAKAPHSRVTSHFGDVQHPCWETLNCRGLWFEEVNDNNFTAFCRRIPSVYECSASPESAQRQALRKLMLYGLIPCIFF